MSWEQDYHIEPIISLLSKLTNKTSKELLIKELNKQGITIIKEEDILLVDNPYEHVKGKKIELSDGRIFTHKLTESYTSNGNYGCNTYKLLLEDEKIKVKHINEDTYSGTKEERIE